MKKLKLSKKDKTMFIMYHDPRSKPAFPFTLKHGIKQIHLKSMEAYRLYKFIEKYLVVDINVKERRKLK